MEGDNDHSDTRERYGRNLFEDDDKCGNRNKWNQGDPLFLSNSDHPGAQLSTSVFDGTNFLSWGRAIEMALGAKKLGFIKGTCIRPERGSLEHGKWERADYMMRCWLLNSMSKDVARGFIYVDSSKQLWDELSERYGQINGPMIFQLKRKLNNTTQDELTVAEYYMKLKKIWDELQVLEGLPECACGALLQCSCSILKRVLEAYSRGKLMQFLMGLNDNFENIRSQVLPMEPLPTVNRAYYLVQQVERQKEVTNGKQTTQENSALNANRQYNNSQSNYNNNKQNTNNNSGYSSVNQGRRDFKRTRVETRKCHHCNQKGHIVEQCFFLHGFPEWYKGPRDKFPQKGSANSAGNVEQGGKDSPFDDDVLGTTQREKQPDNALVAAVYQEVVKLMKGKGLAKNSYANFAGKIS